MYAQDTEFMSHFDQESNQQKYERLIKAYANLSRLGSSFIINVIN